MKRSENRILTTHVGSIVRPQPLRDLAAAAGESAENKERYEQGLRESVAEIVKLQAKAGIDIVNDGEFGKSSWSNYILERITGFEHRPEQLRPVYWLGRDRDRFPDVMAAEFPWMSNGVPTEACVGPIKYRDHASIDRDIGNLKAALRVVRVEEAFLPVVAPASSAYDGVNEYYRTEKDYVYAIADALREEYRAIYESGLLVQVDDAVLANMYDHYVEQSPEKYRQWAGLRIEALNHALQEIPEDRVRYHVCFGSWHVPHLADAPLEEILGFILSVRAGAYSIEAANPRHEHEWRVWETTKLPEGKILIPGVVTHHTMTVEHPRLVADRIVRFARLVGRENLIAGTDCGFAQAQFIQRAAPSVMWAKFEALVEGARIASAELWQKRATA
ncbi:MAG TPA: cobalamin-independent methionine synthase II family protein [Candidatus Acidoferrales bacterium]|jgi:5-methyltetrahydropteroyltriglutamate--homocysteine methyltransferase|nr:cobalamin-independent methionine synthase II family protein [Candidatus Acidoferrales bacterium]